MPLGVHHLRYDTGDSDFSAPSPSSSSSSSSSDDSAWRSAPTFAFWGIEASRPELHEGEGGSRNVTFDNTFLRASNSIGSESDTDKGEEKGKEGWSYTAGIDRAIGSLELGDAMSGSDSDSESESHTGGVAGGRSSGWRIERGSSGAGNGTLSVNSVKGSQAEFQGTGTLMMAFISLDM